MFAYVTVGGVNEVQVYRTDNFSKVATIPVGKLPHGIWPSGDGTRVYVGLENEDQIAAIDTLANKVIATSPIGQAPQAVGYVPNPNPVTMEHGNDDDAGCPRTGRSGEPAAARHRRDVDAALAGGARSESGKSSYQRFAVRPRLGANARGFGYRTRTGESLRVGALDRAFRWRC